MIGRDDKYELLATGDRTSEEITLSWQNSSRPRRWLKWRKQLSLAHVLALGCLSLSSGLIWTLYRQSKGSSFMWRVSGPETEGNYPVYPAIAPIAPGTIRDRSTFRPNLLPNLNYITANSYSGFSNQFLGQQNLLYLASLTQRVALLPPFYPIHIDDGQSISFNDVFDLHAFRRRTGVVAVDWTDVKELNVESTQRQIEPLGCWASLEATFQSGYLSQFAFADLGIQAHMWPMPKEIRPDQGSQLISFAQYTAFENAHTRAIEWIKKLATSDSLGTQNSPLPFNRTRPSAEAILHPPSPVDQVMCLDQTFFVFNVHAETFLHAPFHEIDKWQDNDGWNSFGQHLHFQPYWHEAADWVLHQFPRPNHPHQRFPRQYLAVHYRAGDFKTSFGITPIKQYIERVDDVRRRLQEKKPREAKEIATYAVLLATDETDTGVLNAFRDLGWTVLDHDFVGTVERYGPWAPTIIDAILIAQAQGIVMSPSSTFSGIAGLRARTWHGGVAIEA